MNFRRFVGPNGMADWLSIWNGVGPGVSISISLRSLRIHVVCWAAAVPAIYSTSHVDRSAIICVIDPQNIGV